MPAEHFSATQLLLGDAATLRGCCMDVTHSMTVSTQVCISCITSYTTRAHNPRDILQLTPVEEYEIGKQPSTSLSGVYIEQVQTVQRGKKAENALL